jgi:RloB-like protein
MNRRSSRGYSSRKENTREQRQRFLIVCEGKKTEPNYFNSFRVPGKIIVATGLGENPSRLVESAKKLKKNGDYDQVWCVFDRDSWTPEDFKNAIQNAKAKGFGVAYSNEAFELWYILHFEFLNAGISRQDYSAKLGCLMGQKYLKNSETIYEELLDRQSIAIKNVAKLLQQYHSPNPAQDNPSTTVHLLVQELNQFIP